MPELHNLSKYLLLPELKVIKQYQIADFIFIEAEKVRAPFEICVRCATPSCVSFGRKTVQIKDEPIRRRMVVLKIKKRRYFCKTCKKPFTEPVQGIMPKRRTTQRLRRSILWACENFSNLSQVRKQYRCSSALVYQVFYEQLSLKLREVQNPWPKKIGIDEHLFSRSKSQQRFVTVVTDQSNKRLRAVVLGKDKQSLREQLSYIEGRENVKWVTADLADSYKSFVFEFFPNAQIVADKFHVLRLLSPHLIKRRKNIAASRMTSVAKRQLTASSKKLDHWERVAIWNFLEAHPELKELYSWKERLHSFYRIKGYERAKVALRFMLSEMEKSTLSEIKTLRRTLLRWAEEVLNYFKTGLTNARTEGFNRVAKLVQYKAYGYKSFENYKLRLLSACSNLSF